MAIRLLFDDGWFEPLTGRLETGGRAAALRPRTAAVLECLMRAPDRVVPRAELMQQVWPDTVVTDDSLSQCLKEIRHALGDTAQRIRTVPRVGYAFVGPVQEAGRQAEPAAGVASETRRGGWPHLSMRGWILGGAAALLGVAALLLLLPAAAPPAPLSVVVLPLRSSEPEAAHVAEAFTEAFTRDLSRISGSFVIARSTAASYGSTPPAPRVLGGQLGVRYVVEGTLARTGTEVHTVVRLLDAADSRLLWTEEASAPVADLERWSIDLVGRLARSLQLRLIDAEAERARRRPAAHRDAHDSAMLGWSLWNRQTIADNARARSLFEQAVRLDGDNAMAWSGLANTHISEMYLNPRTDRAAALAAARNFAERGYAIDPQHVHAMGSLATVNALEGRLPQALELFRAQLRVNPNYAPSHMWTAVVEIQLGRPAVALKSARLAERLSPRDARLAYFRTIEAKAHLHLGEVQAARELLERTVSLPGLGASMRPLLVAVLVQQGELEAARALARQLLADQPGYTLAGWRTASAIGVDAFRQREQALIAAAARAGLPG